MQHTKLNNFSTVQYILTFRNGVWDAAHQKQKFFNFIVQHCVGLNVWCLGCSGLTKTLSFELGVREYILTFRQNNCMVPGMIVSDKTLSFRLGVGEGLHMFAILQGSVQFWLTVFFLNIQPLVSEWDHTLSCPPLHVSWMSIIWNMEADAIWIQTVSLLARV